MKVLLTNKMTKTMPFGWMISAMVFYICLYYYIYQSYLDKMAENLEKRQFEDRELRNILEGGWNFGSAPIDREIIAESVQNSQYCYIQACNTKKKINGNF